MIFSFLSFFFEFLLVFIQVSVFYILYFIFYIFKNILNLPIYFLSFVKIFFFLTVLTVKNAIFKLISFFFNLFFKVLHFYVKDAWTCFLVHYNTFFYNWNRFYNWLDFYRILLKVIPNFSVFPMLFLKIEIHSLLIKNGFQFLETASEKLRNLYTGRTLRAHKFRFVRKLIKFTMGVVLLIYPLGFLMKTGLFKFSKFLFSVYCFLDDRGALSKASSITFLRFIIWFKVWFVWKSLPFEVLFTYGISKKYPQFEDVQPDIKVVPAEIWDYALERYCYFDEDYVLNKYYIFHIFRVPTRYLTSTLGLIFILPYLIIKNFSIFIGIVLFLIYTPFIFFWIHAPLTLLFFVWKLPLTFIIFIPVFVIFVIFVIVFIFYKLIYKVFIDQFHRNLFNFVKLTIVSFTWFTWDSRFYTLWNFLIFKIKKFSYYKNNYLAKYLFGLNNLLKIENYFKSLLSKISDNSFSNYNIIGYNSSYVFKRIRSYTLRFKNFQFIKNFLKSYNVYRLTPDQIKAFNKIALNNYYPVYYFERLFYMIYSKAEQELEIPYYLSFMRQAFSDNQDILPPRFHVYGFFNFLTFFWNYFSFLSNKSFANLNLLEVNEFVQLFNLSYGKVFSYLVNDFLSLTKTKKLFFYLSSNKSFLQISTLASSTILYLLSPKHYNVLIRFYWFYLEPPLVRLLFNYYLHLNTLNSIKIYNILHEHISYSWYTFIWNALTELDKFINEAFYSSLKFERFYDINFEKSRDKYELFIFHIAKTFFTRSWSDSMDYDSKQDPRLTSHMNQSLKSYSWASKLVDNKYKDIDQYLNTFFDDSFRLWNYFFQFMIDNVFEFLAKFFDLWQDARSVYISSWATNRKLIIIFFSFLKCFIFIWLFILFLILFGLLYLIRSIFIKMISKFFRYV